MKSKKRFTEHASLQIPVGVFLLLLILRCFVLVYSKLPCNKNCNNNGHCSLKQGKAVCSCYTGYGYSGENCEKASCGNNSCTRHGTCKLFNGGSDIKCTCYKGSKGRWCEKSCNGAESDMTPSWEEWGPWLPCTGGIRRRYRNCTTDNDSCAPICDGPKDASESCPVRSKRAVCGDSLYGWTQWSSYGSCSVTCAMGTQERKRTCQGANTQCSRVCVGDGIEFESTNCKGTDIKNGGWSSWNDQGCSATCGSGVKTKRRSCTNPQPNACGKDCPGNDIQTEICTGLPSCCEQEGNQGARINISPKEVTIAVDSGAAAVSTIITCQAITCPGDTLHGITLKRASIHSPTGFIEYATTDDTGQVVDKVQLPNTLVSGSKGQSFFSYLIAKTRCHDGGKYYCSTVMHKSSGSKEEDDDTATLTVKVQPGRLKLEALGDTSNLKVGDVIQLNCSAIVGTVNPGTKIAVVWQYKDKGSSSWTTITSPTIANTNEPLVNDCDHMNMWEMLTLVFKKEDLSRTYWCYLVKDGVDHGDKPTGNNTFDVLIDSPFNPVSHAMLTIKPEKVVIFNTHPQQASMVCRGMQSQNKLVTLTLSRRVQRENEYTFLEQLVTTKRGKAVNTLPALGKNVNVSGGIFPRRIILTLNKVTCTDAGTYICAAVTKLGTTTETRSKEVEFSVEVTKYRTTTDRKGSSQTEQFTCTALASLDDKDIEWVWECTTPDSSSKLTNWVTVEPSKDVLITDTCFIPGHNCFRVHTSTLTFLSLQQTPARNFYRCVIKVGDKTYVDSDSVFRPLQIGKSHPFDLAKYIAAIVGAAGLLSLLFLIAAILFSRRRARPPEIPLPQERVMVVLQDPTDPPSVVESTSGTSSTSSPSTVTTPSTVEDSSSANKDTIEVSSGAFEGNETEWQYRLYYNMR